MKDVVEKLMKLGEKKNPDQFEAYASQNRIITIRIATNEIVEAKELMSGGCSIRFVKNNSVGFSSTNKLTKLNELVNDSHKLSISKDPDPFFKSFPTPKQPKPVRNLYDKRVFDLDLEEVVEWGKTILDTGLSIDPRVDISGSINVVTEKCWIENSLGIDASDKNTLLLCSLTVEKGERNSSIGESASRWLNGFDVKFAIKTAINSLRMSNEVKRITPGKYRVVFGSQAMADLLDLVINYAIVLPSIDSGISYLYGKLNQKVADERFTLLDDGRHPFGIGTKTVDDEGVPTTKKTIIDRGVLETYYGDSYFVNKLSDKIKGLILTGNGFRFGVVPGREYGMLPTSCPTNLVIEAGDMDKEELVSEVKQGLYIGRIWYTYPINPTVGEFSCTNRSSTFWIENGEIKQSILPNSFRINDNILRLLNNIIGIGKKQEQSVIWGGTAACISPSIGFDDINVSYSKGSK